MVNMDHEKRKAEITSMLRSVTQSSKEGVPLRRLQKDFKMIVGYSIPFKELGYPSLDVMLKDLPDIVRLVYDQSGEIVAHAVADNSTAHIASLIARQRPSKSRSVKKPGRRPVNRIYSTPGSSYVQNRHYQRFEIPERLSKEQASGLKQVYQARSKHDNKPFERYIVPPRFQKLHQAENDASSSFEQDPPSPSWILPEYKRPLLGQAPTSSVSEQAQSKLVVEQTQSRLVTEQTQPNPLIEQTQQRPTTGQGQKATKEKPGLQILYEPSISQRTVQLQKSAKNKKNPAAKKTNKQLVEDYAVKRKIKPIYETLPFDKKGKTYVTNLKLDGKSYTSYPDAKKSIADAEEAAASIAVQKLSLFEGKKNNENWNKPNLPFSRAEAEDEIYVLMERIRQIVSEHPKGIWNKKVEEQYTERHSEYLPPEWLKLLQSQGMFQIDEINRNRYILNLPINGRDTPSSCSSRMSECELKCDSDGSESSLTLQPHSLHYPDGPYWDVYVGYIANKVEVAVSLVDYSEQYEEMLSNMQAYYNSHHQPVDERIQLKLYAIKIEDMWYRGKLLNVEENKAECYCVDHGDVVFANLEDLQELESSFLELPLQAVHCRLAGLKPFAEIISFELLSEYILAKTLVAKVIDRDKIPIPLILYDTSSEDINLNQMLLLDLPLDEIASPNVPEVGKIVQAFITFVTHGGDVYIQISGRGLECLKEEMLYVNSVCEDLVGEVTSVKVDNVYCAKFNDDGKWYRAVVTRILEEASQVEVTYVDYGNNAAVPLTDMCDLESVSPVLKKLPYQALKCTLHGIPPSSNLHWSEEAVERLGILSPPEQDLLLKVIEAATPSSPLVVELFKRLPSGEMVSINAKLAEETSLFRFEEKNTQMEFRNKMISPQNFYPYLKSNTLFIAQRKKYSIPDVALPAEDQKSGRQSLDILPLASPISPEFGNDHLCAADLLPVPPPNIPDVQHKLDVHITLAAHPHNFCFQPWSEGAKLDALMKEMQIFFSFEENIVDMHECLVKDGQFYAGRHTDKSWYRIYVKNIIESEPLTVSAYFIDYGDYSMIELNDLQPLWKQFRHLPMQALQASLSRVEPLEKDWTPFQVIQFSKLVVEKQFVAIIVDKVSDSTLELGCPRLLVKLLDTSDPRKEVDIDFLLVQMGIARLSANYL